MVGLSGVNVRLEYIARDAWGQTDSGWTLAVPSSEFRKQGVPFRVGGE